MTLEAALATGIGVLSSVVATLFALLVKQGRDNAAAMEKKDSDCEAEKAALVTALDARCSAGIDALRSSHGEMVQTLSTMLQREQRKADEWDQVLREESAAARRPPP